jgi:hypothetical protein
MCTPGKPCAQTLDAMREKLDTTIALALAGLIGDCAVEVMHTATPGLLSHVTHGMQTHNPVVIGEALMWALVAERIPEVLGTRDAIAEVRGVLMRRILTPPYTPAVSEPKA